VVRLILISVLLHGGTTWAEPCSDASSCLARKEALTDELALVELKLKELGTIPAKTPKGIPKDDFWVSLDLGLGVIDGLYASAGITVPLGPVHLSPGVWFGSDYEALGTNPERGLYLAVGRSWMLWE
jgi:hypothetical protein